MIIGLIGGALGLFVIAIAPGVTVVLVGWCVAQLAFNALAESFVATLKTECFADSIPPTKAAAKLMIFDYYRNLL
jgi:hypothetical protein